LTKNNVNNLKKLSLLETIDFYILKKEPFKKENKNFIIVEVSVADIK